MKRLIAPMVLVASAGLVTTGCESVSISHDQSQQSHNAYQDKLDRKGQETASTIARMVIARGAYDQRGGRSTLARRLVEAKPILTGGIVSFTAAEQGYDSAEPPLITIGFSGSEFKPDQVSYVTLMRQECLAGSTDGQSCVDEVSFLAADKAGHWQFGDQAVAAAELESASTSTPGELPETSRSIFVDSSTTENLGRQQLEDAGLVAKIALANVQYLLRQP